MLGGAGKRLREVAAALICAALLGSCAHEPVREPAVPVVVWPPPPATPRARYLGALPDTLMAPPPRSFWGSAWDFFIGARPAAEPMPLLERPFGLAVRGDDLFVADPGAREVLRIQWRGHTVTPIRCENRRWAAPMAVAVAPDGTLYVADAAAAAIIRVDPSGECRALGAGALQRPTGVALAAGRVYAVDPPSHAVVAFSPDGREVLRFGGRGDNRAQLNFPTGIAARSDGALLVVDTLKFRIVVFAADGRYISDFGEAGDGNGALGRPKAVTLDGAGRMFVSDMQNDVVVIFGPDREFDFAIGGTGQGPGQLTLPAGVAIAGDLLFVADSYNHRVAAYQLLGGAR